MARSAWKGPNINEKLYKKVVASLASKSTQQIKTWARSCDIIPDFIGAVIAVHNGKAHIPVFITENMVGHKLGEFAPTRKYVVKAAKKGGR
jgi:small subunit ribosomal protein S19